MTEMLNKQVESMHGNALDLPPITVSAKVYDSVTIKHVSYVGLAAVESIFLLWCTYTGSYVASFAISTDEFKADQSFDVTILLNRPSSPMGFKLFYYDPDDGILKPSTFEAFMSITLSFTKYNKKQ
jgi:hypothetical protein